MLVQDEKLLSCAADDKNILKCVTETIFSAHSQRTERTPLIPAHLEHEGQIGSVCR